MSSWPDHPPRGESFADSSIFKLGADVTYPGTLLQGFLGAFPNFQPPSLQPCGNFSGPQQALHRAVCLSGFISVPVAEYAPSRSMDSGDQGSALPS